MPSGLRPWLRVDARIEDEGAVFRDVSWFLGTVFVGIRLVWLVIVGSYKCRYSAREIISLIVRISER